MLPCSAIQTLKGDDFDQSVFYSCEIVPITACVDGFFQQLDIIQHQLSKCLLLFDSIDQFNDVFVIFTQFGRAVGRHIIRLLLICSSVPIQYTRQTKVEVTQTLFRFSSLFCLSLLLCSHYAPHKHRTYTENTMTIKYKLCCSETASNSAVRKRKRNLPSHALPTTKFGTAFLP